MTKRRIYLPQPINVPSVEFDEDVQINDSLSLGTILTDEIEVNDQLVLGTILTDELQVNDSLIHTIDTLYSEGNNVNDLFTASILNVNVPRTGTPDTDKMFDAYVDQALPTTNFGNADLKIKKSTAVGNNEKKAILTIDLTELGDFTAGNNGAGFGFNINYWHNTTNVALAQAYTVQVYAASTKPFTESTVTWDNGATVGSLIRSFGFLAPVGAPALRSALLSVSETQQAIGKWLTYVFIVDAIADTGIETVTITSRDAAANRPTFDLYLKRGT